MTRPLLLALACVPLLGGCIFPSCAPACDELDPVRPEVSDGDRDGYDHLLDCDDTNIQVHPEAPDPPGDGVDQDCNGYDADPRSVPACTASRPAAFAVAQLGDSRLGVDPGAATCFDDGHLATHYFLYPGVDGQEVEASFRVESPTPHAILVRADCTDDAPELGCAAGPDLTLQIHGYAPVTVAVVALGEPGPFTLFAERAPLGPP